MSAELAERARAHAGFFRRAALTGNLGRMENHEVHEEGAVKGEEVEEAGGGGCGGEAAAGRGVDGLALAAGAGTPFEPAPSLGLEKRLPTESCEKAEERVKEGPGVPEPGPGAGTGAAAEDGPAGAAATPASGGETTAPGGVIGRSATGERGASGDGGAGAAVGAEGAGSESSAPVEAEAAEEEEEGGPVEELFPSGSFSAAAPADKEEG
jgi:hypothetical protein